MKTIRLGALVLLLQLLLALPGAFAGGVQVGASYDEVVAALGEPDGDLSAGSKRILAYGDAQVVLDNGRVSKVSPELDQLLAERSAKLDSVEAKRKAGLVSFRGEWVTQAEVNAILRKEAKEAEASGVAPSSPGGTGWLTNFEQAKAKARAEQKKILLNFTGSDWCGWCIKLDREVFSQREFLNYARDHYVLVKLDFPKRTSQPSSLKRQNEDLARKFGVRGFPTVVVLKSNGREHKRGGYVRGGPNAFLKSIR